jgi:hypothetical protein
LKIIIRSFQAIEYPDICELFLKSHTQVLIDYGITNITTNNRDWFKMKNVYVVVAFNEDRSKLIGGVRVHIADGKEILPLEKAIGKMDNRIHNIINKYIEKGTGELCGLWNAKEVAGFGISAILVRAGISIVNQIKLNSLFTICAEYTLPMVKKVGFIVEDSIGKEGRFVYPNENYIARVLKKINAITLETAEDYDRNRMINLRNNPIQLFNEVGPKGEVQTDYNLIVSNFDK